MSTWIKRYGNEALLSLILGLVSWTAITVFNIAKKQEADWVQVTQNKKDIENIFNNSYTLKDAESNKQLIFLNFQNFQIRVEDKLKNIENDIKELNNRIK